MWTQRCFAQNKNDTIDLFFYQSLIHTVFCNLSKEHIISRSIIFFNMKQSASFLSLLLSFVLTQHASAFNFEGFDTPLLDAVAEFLCDDDSEGPLCSLFDALGGGDDSEEREGTEGETSGPSLGSFLFRTGCNIGLVPETFCGDDDEEAEAGTLEGDATLDDATLVDGLLLGLLCGEDGYAPPVVCTTLVGQDRDSGLIRRFCENGRILPAGVCDLVGVPTPEAAAEQEEGVDNGGRNLRH